MIIFVTFCIEFYYNFHFINCAEMNFGEWTPEYYIKNQEICNSILNNPELLNQIPSLNSLASHNFTHGQLVRFQGMIQDMYNPEYYFERYEVKNTQTGESFVRCGLYKDSAKCQVNIIINNFNI